MFHDASSSFGRSTSLSRTAVPSQSLIHNDENANTFSKQHTNSKNHASSNTNSNMNPNSSSKQTFASMNAKSKTPLNTRRRALGDISNRKNEGSDATNNGTGKASKSNTKSKSTGFSIYTPHKEGGNAKKGLAPSSLQQASKKFPSSTVKKKTVSFAIHAQPDLELKEVSQKEMESKSENALKGMMKSFQRSRLFDNEEDIELSAGRTGLEQRKLLAGKLDRVDAYSERDIEEALNAIRAAGDQDDLDDMPPKENDFEQEAIIFEEVDDDVLQSYLMFDEYKGLDLELNIGEGEDDVHDDLMSRIDDLSI